MRNTDPWSPPRHHLLRAVRAQEFTDAVYAARRLCAHHPLRKLNILRRCKMVRDVVDHDDVKGGLAKIFG